MPTEVIMPKVDMDMASGIISVWHIAEGEAVEKGEPLFDIETDKAAMEVEAPSSGILHFPTPEGSEVPIGAPCAWLYAEGEEVGAPPNVTDALSTDDASSETVILSDAAFADGALVDATATQVEPHAHGTRATPKARALAARHGLDIGDVAGDGPRGRVQAEDVQRVLDALEAPAMVSSAPASVQFETGPLSVTRSKRGTGTPIVMVHGFASDATSWAPIEAHLRDRPVIRIDLPCHGKSPKLKTSGFAELLKILRQAFDDLNLDTAHLVGHSLGGALCLGLADTRPKSVAALTLIAPAGLGPEINGTALGGICNATRTESLAPWLRSLVSNEDRITDSYTRLAMAARSDPNLRAAQKALAQALFPDGVQAFDLRAALGRVEMPTRIVWGKRDAIIPWQHALKAGGPVGLHLFDDIGHMPQLECPEYVASIIASNG